jgi:hypothetical protein
MEPILVNYIGIYRISTTGSKTWTPAGSKGAAKDRGVERGECVKGRAHSRFKKSRDKTFVNQWFSFSYLSKCEYK